MENVRIPKIQSYQELSRKTTGVVEPAYLERRGMGSHRVARTPGSPRVLANLSRLPSGQLTSGAADKVVTILKGGLPEISPFPLSTPESTIELSQLPCLLDQSCP